MIYFNCHVRDLFVNAQKRFVLAWGLWPMRYDAHGTGKFISADAPHVKIAHACVSIRLQGRADFLYNIRVHFPIQKDSARIPNEAPSPNGDDNCSNDSHDGIRPVPMNEFSEHQGDNCEERGGGVRNHMQVSCSQIEIPVRVVVGVRMPVSVIVITQPPRAQYVYSQTNRGYNDCLIENDGHGVE